MPQETTSPGGRDAEARKSPSERDLPRSIAKQNLDRRAKAQPTPEPKAESEANAPDVAAVFRDRTFGLWTLIRLDGTAKRALCRCRCGTIREVALDALETGASKSCGCFLSAKPQRRAADRAASLRPASTFASGIAEAETVTSHGRHKGRT
jgi:hypothetical protein